MVLSCYIFLVLATCSILFMVQTYKTKQRFPVAVRPSMSVGVNMLQYFM